MKYEIKVPSMGESISEATVGEILKSAGSMVETDEEILELETDKVNQVLYAPNSGLLELMVQPGDVVKIGQTLGLVDSDGSKKEKSPSSPKKEPSAKAPPPPPPLEEPTKIEPPSSLSSARETKEEFISELKSPAHESQPSKPIKVASDKRTESRKKMSSIRKVIATRLVQAKQETAMLTTFNEIDMSVVMEMRARQKEEFFEQHGVKLGFMSFFVKACVFALKQVPEINSSIDGEEIVQRDYYDIGIAVGTERGLVVPVLRDCDHLSFSQIEQSIGSFAEKSRSGRLSVDDLQGGGFTITNGGVYGSLLSTPILNPPQSGILGMHKIEKRAVVIDNEIAIRPMMYVALSYDHRIVDGKEAVTFLVRVKEAIEDPTRLLLEI